MAGGRLMTRDVEDFIVDEGADKLCEKVNGAWQSKRPNGSAREDGNNVYEFPQPPIRFLSKKQFVGDFEPPDYLIDGILQRRFIYSLTAKTGHGKTAVALHLTKLISSTSIFKPMLGPHQVDKGKVLYLAGENRLICKCA
jgi:hypothetical protein